MPRHSIRIAALAWLAICLPTLSSAQMQSWKDVQVADIETMKGKFIGLAEAFSESQ